MDRDIFYNYLYYILKYSLPCTPKPKPNNNILYSYNSYRCYGLGYIKHY